MDWKGITVNHMACKITDLAQFNFFLWGLLRTRPTGHKYVIWQTYKKEFMLLSTMSHHK